MNKLPEKVGVILIYKDKGKFRKTQILKNYETISNAYVALDDTNRPCRIYPVNTRYCVHLTDFNIHLAWGEAMSLKEFEEYLND